MTKKLQTRLDEINVRRSEIKSQRKTNTQRFQEEKQKLHREEQLLIKEQNMIAKALKDGRPEMSVKISDHALVRWLERVQGIDVEALRRKVLTKKQIQMAEIGCHKIKTNNGVFVIENMTVKTVLPKGVK